MMTREQIDPKTLLVEVAPILNELGIQYFITGGFAVAVWGRPRATWDIDIVVKLIEPQINSLASALRKISELGYIDENTAKEAVKNNGEFNFIDPVSGVKVDFWVAKNDERTTSEFENRKLETVQNQEVYFISPEDLIISKLNWHKEGGSSLQLEDVKSILKTSGKKLDMTYIKQWAAKFSVSDILEILLKDKKD